MKEMKSAMTQKPAVPLEHRQIEAALHLYQKCKRWQATDKALDFLARSFPDCHFESILLKAAAVNALYGTQVYAIAEVAEHLCSVLGNTTLPATPGLVDELAKMRLVRGAKQITRTFRSFASKFAHFFIDPDRFPIYDRYAVKMLTYHLNGKGREELSYDQFAASFSALKDALDIPVTTRELDRYLWLGGQLRAWKGLMPWRRPYTGINSELLHLFETPAGEVQELTRAVLGRGENP